jgi:hypothetical protein
MRPRSRTEAILGRLEMGGPGCWEWQGALSCGYGSVKVGTGSSLVHRLVYELIIGPIPDGLQIDHLCRNRRCARPSHLEPVTQRVNLLRGNTLTAMHAAKTHCVNGHELVPENVWVRPRNGNKSRTCRVCIRKRNRESKVRRVARRRGANLRLSA